MPSQFVQVLDDFQDLIEKFDIHGMNLGLERMQNALKELGNPCSSIPAIQIVGTNGKGSIASFLTSTLEEAKIKAGIATSPHLVSWCERIRANGKLITSKQLRELLINLQGLARSNQLTPFELLLAASFSHFENCKVELLVLEVGLGGRLDATSAHPYRPVIAISSIGRDHCAHLGESLKEIAYEKGSVITPGSTVISGKQHPEVVEILEKIAKEKNSTIKWVSPIPRTWSLGLAGEIQRLNAAVAIGALKALEPYGWKVSTDHIKKGLALAKWNGRLQSVSWGENPLLIDGAHNPPAAEQLSKERCNWEHQEMGVTWIIGIQKHKEGPAILHNLLMPKDKAWIVPIPEHISWTKSQLLSYCPEFRTQLFSTNSVEEALSEILEKSWPNPPPVIVGSLYLLGILISKNILKMDTSIS